MFIFAKLRLLILGYCILISAHISIASASAQQQQEQKKQRFSDIIKRIDEKYRQLETLNTSRPLSTDSADNSNTDLDYLTDISKVVSIGNVASAEPPIQQSRIPEGVELLLAIYIDKLYLADVFGFKTQSGAIINLNDLAEVLDFPISIDFDIRVASGWFISEENTFEFSFSEGTKEQSAQVSIKGNEQLIANNAFSIIDDELYVDALVLSEWFGLNVSFSFSDMRMILKPDKPLPIQLQIARRNKRVAISSVNEASLPWKESSYQMLSSPLVDVQIQHLQRSMNNAKSTNFSALGSHDLAYMNTEYYLSGRSQVGLSDARIKFSKVLKDKGSGFLPKGTVEIGDINSVTITNEYRNGLNRGLSFSKNVSNLTNNQRINLNGNIQPGWDVEVYQNNILIAKQTSVQNGRYEFNNIDLNFGENTFEIIAYGPQGQVKREYKDVFIDRNALEATENDYAVSITQLGKSLLNVNDEIVTKNEGLLLAGRYSRGITDWFSFALGQTSLISDKGEDEYNYSLATNMTMFERLLLNASVNVNQDDEYSSYVTGRTQFIGQSLQYSFRQQQNIDILDNIKEQKSDSLHTFRISGQLPKLNKVRINYNNQFLYRDDYNGIKTIRFQNQLSLSSGRFSIQHSLDWLKTKSLLDTSETLFGYAQFQRNFWTVFTRLSAGYSINPELELNSIKAELSWSLFSDVQSELTLDYLPEKDLSRAELGLNWHGDDFNLSGNFKYDSQDEWTFGLYLRFAFGYDFKNDRAFLSADSIARNGAMAVRVFEDENNDGLYNLGENIIEGVKVKAVQSQRHAVSGDDGVAVIENLRNEVRTDIVIDTNSLSEPFFIPSTKGVSITPRKGFLGQVDYPVVTSGEIDGTIYSVDTKGNQQNLAYVPINLLNEDGEIVDSTQSEYDGYYLFVDLIPGRYFVSVEDGYLKKHKLDNAGDLALNLTTQGDVLNGSDFTLRELDFTKGFVANAGSFNDLAMLKVYWQLIQRRYRAKLKQSAFYFQDTDSDRFQLNLAFYKDKQEAQQACKQILELDIQCNVEAFEFVER